jgi:hypothetical protein
MALKGNGRPVFIERVREKNLCVVDRPRRPLSNLLHACSFREGQLVGAPECSPILPLLHLYA